MYFEIQNKCKMFYYTLKSVFFNNFKDLLGFKNLGGLNVTTLLLLYFVSLTKIIINDPNNI